MNPRFILTVAAAACGAWSATVNAAPSPCESVSKRVQADCAARPERVLVVVEDGVVQNEGCACEIVKAAIVGASANSKLVGEIVFTAASGAPSAATTIAECALAAAPDASAEIKSGLKRALGDKVVDTKTAPSRPAPTEEATVVADGKNPVGKGPVGKGPVGKTVISQPTNALTPEDDADFGLSPVSIGGVYLVYPSAGGLGASDDCECDDDSSGGNKGRRGLAGGGTGGNTGKEGKRKRTRPPGRIIIPPVTAGDSNTPTPDNTPTDNTPSTGDTPN